MHLLVWSAFLCFARIVLQRPNIVDDCVLAASSAHLCTHLLFSDFVTSWQSTMHSFPADSTTNPLVCKFSCFSFGGVVATMLVTLLVRYQLSALIAFSKCIVSFFQFQDRTADNCKDTLKDPSLCAPATGIVDHVCCRPSIVDDMLHFFNFLSLWVGVLHDVVWASEVRVVRYAEFIIGCSNQKFECFELH